MPRYDAQSAVCRIHTYKDGLLSAIAHDLELRVERFAIVVAGTAAAPAIEARFDAGSLRVVTAMHDGRPQPSALSAGDRRKIEENIAGDVLDARRYPEIAFVSSEVTREGAGWRVAGRLTLHGRTRELVLVTRAMDGRQIAEHRLHQPDYGVRPYTAMLGTLKIRADVDVRVELPDEPPA